MNTWWQMGGNGFYVWTSVAITLLVLALNMFWAARALRTAEARARRRAKGSEEGQ